MASFQKTLNLDTLTVTNINARATNNSNIPAFRVLTTDGLGGTMWMTLSSLKDGGAFNSIITTAATYRADSSGTSFSILDGPNAGLINDPTASNTAYLYAKAFGQFDISGGNSIVAFDTVTNKVNSNVKFVGTGGISIRGDPQKNIMTFDGRELPFISTVPYSFSRYRVYSNVPYNTSVASTFSSIILQANSPSSILSFVGIDPLVIYTDFQTNQIKISLSSLNAERISTILSQQTFLISTSITKTDLSSFSSAVGEPISVDDLRGVASSLSTGLTRRILVYSTSIGNVKDYSRGISTVWNASQKNTFLLSLSTVTMAQSTNVSVNADITNLYDLIQADYNVIRGSTIETPFFWTSTLVTPLSSNYSPLVTPDSNVGNINLTYYPIYSSFYNVFNQAQTIGNPIKPTIYPTDMIIDRNNHTSNVSSLGGTIFSNNYALRGSFIFYPEDDARTFFVNYKGILSLNVFGQQYGPIIPEYPRMELFTNTVSTVTDTIPGFAPVTVSFTFLKLNPTDYISFSNFYDVLEGTESYDVAPIYPAHGYNTSEQPLYEDSILNAKFPIGFSTVSLLSVSPPSFQALSTYVLVLNTTYNSGCNTIFPLSTSGGFTTMSFHETTSGKNAEGYVQDLSRGISSVLQSSFSASNAFGYTFKDNIPSTSYTLNLVYGRSKPTENLLISSLIKAVDSFDRAYAVYYSSFLYGSSISSYNGYFVNLNAETLNLNNLNLSSLYLSSLLYTSNVSSFNGNFVNLYAQYFTISTLEISTTIQSYTFNTSSLTVSSINGIALPFNTGGDGSSSSSISTFLGNLINLNSSLSTTVSSFTSPFSSFIYNAISSFSTAMGQVGTGTGSGTGDASSTISSFITYVEQLASTVSGEASSFDGSSTNGIMTYENVISTISTFSTAMGQVGSGTGTGTGDASSTISSFITYVEQLASSISADNSTISTGIATSLTTSIEELASTIDGNLTNFTPNNYLPEIYTSTLHTSSIITSGLRQPFIQYGTAFSPNTETEAIINLPVSYANNNYVIQVTSQTDSTQIYISQAHKLNNMFKIVFATTTGTANVILMWTTFGDIF